MLHPQLMTHAQAVRGQISTAHTFTRTTPYGFCLGPRRRPVDLKKHYTLTSRGHDIFSSHDDAIKWKQFSRYWPFVRGIHRSPMNSRHKGQWRGALMFSLICAWINGLVNNREAGDLRRHCVHYGVTVMQPSRITCAKCLPQKPRVTGILLIGIVRTKFGEALIEIHIFSYKKMHLKMSGK